MIFGSMGSILAYSWCNFILETNPSRCSPCLSASVVGLVLMLI
jgi:hypothetical protein